MVVSIARFPKLIFIVDPLEEKKIVSLLLDITPLLVC